MGEETKKIATREAYGNALVKLGGEKKDVVVLDADLSKSTYTKKFADAFPDRFFNIGVAEQDMMGTAAGLAAAGKVPFASSFAIFATGRAWEQVRNTICYGNLNVKIVATHGGVSVGADGSSHQSIEDVALMRVLPNMKVIVPADGLEAELAVREAAKTEGPVYIRMGRAKVPIIMRENYKFKLGKSVKMATGNDVGIIACGAMVSESLRAREMLANEGVTAEVINMATIKPIDESAIIELASRTGAVVTAEEHNVIGGLGSAVAEVLVEKVPVPAERVGVKDKFGQSGTPEELFEHYHLTANDIKKAAKKVIDRKK
jgi:transketolase